MTGLCLALLLTGAAPAPAVPVRGAEVTAASAGTDILLKRPRQFPVRPRAGATIKDRGEIEVLARRRSWDPPTATPPAPAARLVGAAWRRRLRGISSFCLAAGASCRLDRRRWQRY